MPLKHIPRCILTAFLFLFNFTFAGSLIPYGFTFEKDIRFGETVTPDVSYLQYLLNQNPETKVADTGPGSNTELTNYFGPKTRDALIRFQNLYASEILTPAGLTKGTGFLGPNSRRKLNSLAQKTEINSTITPQTPGTQSTSSLYTAPRPQLIGVVPNLVVGSNNLIDIYGYNFLPKNNSVITNYGTIEAISSEQNTIKIGLSDLPQFNLLKELDQATVFFRIRNTNGISNETGGVKYIKNQSIKISTTTDINSLGVADEQLITDKMLESIVGTGAASAGVSALSATSQAADSASTAANFNFGGKLSNIIYCTCSGGQLLTIQDVRGQMKNLFFRYGQSTLRENYNIYSTGVNVLGGYTPSATQCQVYSGESCDTQGIAEGDIDTIRGIGTSIQ